MPLLSRPSIPALPGGPVAALDPLAVGLVEWWDFDEQAGSSMGRVSGLAAVPLPAGGVPLRIAGAEGWARGLVRTRGQCLVVPDNPLLRLPTNLTGFSFTWVCRATIASFLASSGILTRSNTGANNPEFEVTTQVADRLQARLQTLASAVTVTSPANELISLNTFFLFRVWLDNAAQTWNIQIGAGAKTSISTAGKTFTPTNPTTQFGRYSNFWDGGIDLAAYWVRVLSDAEWTRLQSGGDGGRPLVYPFAATRSLTILSPFSYQVVQRNAWAAGAGTATFTIDGTYRGAAGAGLEVSLAGSAWQAASGTISGGRFSVSVTFPVSQGDLLVRWTDATSIVGSASMVGVGDAIATSGQSQIAGRILTPQPVTNPPGLMATMLGNDGVFKPAADPIDAPTATPLQTVNNDALASTGSYLPKMLSDWMADRQVPVMIIPASMGSTLSVAWAAGADHLSQATLYGALNARALIGGPVGFHLRHLGESDALNNTTSAATFTTQETAAADAFFADRAVKTFLANIEPQTGVLLTDTQRINGAITGLWAAGGNILAGPDFSDISYRANGGGGVHWLTSAEATRAGAAWYAAVKAVMGA